MSHRELGLCGIRKIYEIYVGMDGMGVANTGSDMDYSLSLYKRTNNNSSVDIPVLLFCILYLETNAAHLIN
jgi:hypothetical protein